MCSRSVALLLLLLACGLSALASAVQFDPEAVPAEVAEGESGETDSGEDTNAFQGATPVRTCALPTDEPTEADAEVALIDAKNLGDWKDYPVRECDITVEKDCDCHVKWIKKVYPIRHLPCRKPLPVLPPTVPICRRHRRPNCGCGGNRNYGGQYY